VKKHWLTLAAIAFLGLLIWLPRALALEHVVTADERKWLARSANFDYALAQRDLAATFQREHPGVTVMWAGALGIEQNYPTYASEAPGFFGWAQEEFEYWLKSTGARQPLDLLNAGRRWIILFVAMGAVIAYFGLRQLAGRSLAFLALLYTALDPFFIAHSFELHPDGLLSILFLAAALNFLAWLYGGGQWRYLLLSGLAMGLAGLTKTPAIFLAPAALLLVCLELIRGRQPHGRLLLGIAAWGGLAVATVIVVWPALWVNPFGTLNAMVRELILYAEGHINPNYFMQQTTRDPGLLFYPVVFLLRSTPTTLLGLAAVLILRITHKWPFSNPLVCRASDGLLLFALIFTLGVNLGAKKFDRYLLPALLCLDVLAALGLVGLVRVFIRLVTQDAPMSDLSRISLKAATLAVSFVLLLSGHGLLALQHRPYFLTYYNPFFGGASSAERMIMIGWGEGLDEAADWLNGQANADQQDVVAWYGDGPLSYFLEDARPVLDFWRPDFWLDADYAVVYVNQRQRDIPTEQALRTIEQEELLHVVRKHGVDWVRIYRMPTELPDFVDLETDSATEFADQLQLAAYTLGERSVLAGDRFLIRLHLRKLRDTPASYRQIVRLLAPDDREVWRNETVLDATPQVWPVHTYVHSFAEMMAPAGLPSGSYRITVAYCDVERPTNCLAPAEMSIEADPNTHLVAAVNVNQAEAVAKQYAWDELTLRDLRYDSQLQPDATALVNLTADVRTVAPLKLSLRLVDSTQHIVAQADVPIAGEMEIRLDIPTDFAPGEYALVAIVYDQDTLAPFPDRDGNFETTLVTFQAGESAE
jgi:hypothetical protein